MPSIVKQSSKPNLVPDKQPSENQHNTFQSAFDNTPNDNYNVHFNYSNNNFVPHQNTNVNNKDPNIFQDLNNRNSSDNTLDPIDAASASASTGFDFKDSSNAVYPSQHVLHANRFTIGMMTRSPGTDLFSFWFTVSTFTPTILACLGPLANMISIAAIVDPWRLSMDDTTVIRDKSWVLAINIVSLIAGFSANILLVLNFTGRIQYTFAQVGSIFMWLCASITLSVDLFLVWRTDYFGTYDHSGGFFFGCFTCAIYFACFLLLLINYCGYLLKEYDETFNLDESQRGLMIHTVMLGAWLIIGAGVFSRLIGPMPYSLSVYFCSITILTIGLGDVVPQTNVSRALSLAFTFFGVLELGLVIAWLRQFVFSNIGPTLFWHRLERARQRLIKSLDEKGIVLDGRESFEAITRLRIQCEFQQRIFSLISTLLSYVMFWLMGALVFCRTEKWTYFEATYFCFLCLLTTGYGDFAPKSSLGRSFFVIWALAAIPMMTLLISSVGDALFAIATHLDDFLSSLTGLKEYYQEKHPRADHFGTLLKNAKKGPESRQSVRSGTRPMSHTLTALSSLIARESVENRDRVSISDDEERLMQAATLANLSGFEYRKESLRIFQGLLDTTNNNPDKIHSFEEWAEILYLVGKNPMEDMFFLADSSPLQYPLKEAAYMMDKVMQDIQVRTDMEVEETLNSNDTAAVSGTDYRTPEDEGLETENNRSSARMFRPASLKDD